MRGDNRSYCIGSGGFKVAAFILGQVSGALFHTRSIDKPVIFVTVRDIITRERCHNDTT